MAHSFYIDPTFHTEETLNETKDVVRRKLGLPESTNVHLAQLRGETIVDLEDGAFNRPFFFKPAHPLLEDDFDAFYAVAHSKMAVDVRVTTEPTVSFLKRKPFSRSISYSLLPTTITVMLLLHHLKSILRPCESARSHSWTLKMFLRTSDESL